jgi:hypothetical protein
MAGAYCLYTASTLPLDFLPIRAPVRLPLKLDKTRMLHSLLFLAARP